MSSDDEIHEKWSKIITENVELQRGIDSKIDQLKTTMQDRGDADPAPLSQELLDDIDFILGMLVSHVKPVRGEPTIELEGRKSKKSKKARSSCKISSFTPQEIEKRARAMNLMDFPSFVRLLNTINQANQGKLQI